MSKKRHYNEAERLFICDGLSADEIARKFEISRRTIFYWKKEYNWDKKRADYLFNNTRMSFEINDFTRKLMDKIMTDIDNNRQVSQSEIYTVLNLIKRMLEIKNYEDEIVKAKKEEKPKELTPELIMQINKDILGWDGTY
ncbi:MAG: helix-turn-helix domain-containing protein [Candidatus Gastranaerophilales bacterium]|nr:helix-turn-helix domain-containing protein [Candidatus Gastranaerophilales bacterium]